MARSLTAVAVVLALAAGAFAQQSITSTTDATLDQCQVRAALLPQLRLRLACVQRLQAVAPQPRLARSTAALLPCNCLSDCSTLHISGQSCPWMSLCHDAWRSACWPPADHLQPTDTRHKPDSFEPCR